VFCPSDQVDQLAGMARRRGASPRSSAPLCAQQGGRVCARPGAGVYLILLKSSPRGRRPSRCRSFRPMRSMSVRRVLASFSDIPVGIPEDGTALAFFPGGSRATDAHAGCSNCISSHSAMTRRRVPRPEKVGGSSYNLQGTSESENMAASHWPSSQNLI
jgi:hypothetical protein